MPRIELAGPADLNFVRRAWAQDVTDSSEIRLELRDLVLARASIVVLRPDDCPPDTIGAFIVLSPTLAHWAGTKRSWRGLGYGTMLLEHAEAALLGLEVDPDNAEAVNTIFRAFHTIKGTSAFLALDYITELSLIHI